MSNKVNLYEPELRFLDFTDNWCKKQMKDICVVSQGLQIPISERFTENDEGRYFYITNEFLKENAEKEYYIENPPKSVICTENDVLMTRTGNTGKVITNVNGVFHNNFFKIDYDDSIIDKDFLCYFLNNFNTQKMIMRLAGTSTIPDLNHKDFYSIKISFPSLTEQNKIVRFLRAVDKKIDLLERKLVLYEKHIISIRESLFKNLDEYKVFKLKEIADVKKGVQLNKSDMVEDGKYYVLNGGKEPSGYTNTWNVNENTITISEGGYCGYVFLNLEKFYCGGHCYYLDLKNKNSDVIYLYHYLKSIENDIMRLRVGSAIKNIQKRDVENVKIILPDMQKQKKLGTFLSLLEKKIIISTIEKQNMDNFKKGLLQKMFV